MAKSRRKTAQAAARSESGPTAEALQHSYVEIIPTPRNTSVLPVSRRIGMHDRLVKADKITVDEWQWASRYCLDLERVQGARPGKPDVESEQSACGRAIYDRRAMAATFIRASDGRMSREQRDIVISACVQAHRVCDVAIVCGILPGDDETLESFAKRVDGAVKARVISAIQTGSGSKQASKPMKIKDKITA